jgi:hypothetical protein
MRWGGIFFRLVTFYFLGKLVAGAVLPQRAPYGGSYFPFVMLGLALASFQGVALTAISSNVLYGMYSGTLEAMLVTRTSLSTIVFASMLYQFLMALFEIFLYLGFSLLFFGVSLARLICRPPQSFGAGPPVPSAHRHFIRRVHSDF